MPEIDSKYLDSENYEKVWKCYRYSREHIEDAIADSEEAMNYAITGIQWDDESINEAETNDKPYLTYNIITPTLNTLIGGEQSNRRRAKFKPRNLNDIKIADIIQNRFNAINDEQNLEELIQIAFADGLITKLGGWIERVFEINEQGYLDYKYRLCNQFRIYPDPELLSYDAALDKCNWVIKETFENLETINSKFNVDLTDNNKKEGFWWSLIDSVKRITSKAYSEETDNYDKYNDKYRILEMLERINTKINICFNGENIIILTEDEYKEKKNTNLKFLYSTTQKRIMVTVILPYFKDAVIYKKVLSNPSNNFGLFNIFSFRFNAQAAETASLVDNLISPQDDINKSKSQIRDYVSQILAGLTAVIGREDEAVKLIQEKGNQPNLVVQLRSPNSDIKKISPQNVPPELFMQSESGVTFTERLSQVVPALKAQSEKSGESGILYEKKLEVAHAANNPYYKSVSLLRKEIARDFLKNFSWVYNDSDRILDLTTNKGESYQEIVNLNFGNEIINDVRNPEVKIELDEGEDNLTRREENFNQLIALSNVIAQINPAFVDIKTLLKNAPIQGIEDWIDFYDAVREAQSQIGQENQDLDKMQRILENEKIRNDILTNEGKLRIEAAKAENDKNKLNKVGVSKQ